MGIDTPVAALPAPHFEPLYTKRQAAAALSVSLGTIDNLIRAGRLRAIKINSACRIHPAELRRFLEGSQEQGGSQE